MTEVTTLDVPMLTTALTGPLLDLEKNIINKQHDIEAWFKSQWKETPAPLYGSVDLRNAGFKLAPIDMNLYPAGFNNLNPDFMPLCIEAAKTTLQSRFPNIKRIAIIPENHTRNLFYWENVHRLETILQEAGYEVAIGSLIETLSEPMTLDLPSGKTVTLHPLAVDQQNAIVGDMIPDLLWLNNDLSDGIPDILKTIQQPICPSMQLGWHARLKSVHFNHYQNVAEAFGKFIGIDPWFINPLFQYCGRVDFMKREGETCLAHNVEILLKAIQKKYDEYGIDHEPFVIVKADSGTYGMGVMMVKSAEEIISLNRKQRTKMAASKGQSVSRVIMQEGVYTFERFGKEQTTAEPVVYMIGPNVIGGFYRLHKGKGTNESLNAPGMHFEPLEFKRPCNTPNAELPPDDCPNRFYAYGVVARLSMLAAAREAGELSA